MVRIKTTNVAIINLLGLFVVNWGLVSSTLIESGMIITFNRLPYILQNSAPSSTGNILYDPIGGQHVLKRVLV